MAALKLTITSWGVVELDKKGQRALMRSAANSVKSKTARLINRSAGGGRLYYGGGGSAYRGQYKTGRYTASAPGEPPVRVTGTLRDSLKAYTYKDGNGFAVRERAFYSLFLEAGARGGRPGSRRSGHRRRRPHAAPSSTRVLAARPHLDRVMQQEQAELDRRIEKALVDGLKWRETK